MNDKYKISELSRMLSQYLIDNCYSSTTLIKEDSISYDLRFTDNQLAELIELFYEELP